MATLDPVAARYLLPISDEIFENEGGVSANVNQ